MDRSSISGALLPMLLAAMPPPVVAQVPCESFASGPFVNIQTPPCEGSCGTPVMPGFQVFGNEAYLINAIRGSQYTVDFCNGYSAATWPAGITVALSDLAGGVVPGSTIASTTGCSLTFSTPASETYVIIVSVANDCGGPNLPVDNGFLSLDCGPNGALCTAIELPCESFASGPFVNIQTPPCGASCGTPVMPGFQVFANEAYLLNGIADSQYTVDFCNGYSAATWSAGITVAVSDDAGGIVPGSNVAWGPGCSLTFTTPVTDTYVIVLSTINDCGGPNDPTDNGFLSLDCGPNGASCVAPPLPCEQFASGPFVNVQTPPCGASCGTPLMPGFEVFGNEAYLINGVAGSQYTLDFCAGHLASRWDPGITVALSDDAGGVQPASSIAWNPGCALTFTAPANDTYVAVISVLGDCGGANIPVNNGLLSFGCGPQGALCANVGSLFLDSFDNVNIYSPMPSAAKAQSCTLPAFDAISRPYPLAVAQPIRREPWTPSASSDTNRRTGESPDGTAASTPPAEVRRLPDQTPAGD